MVTSSVIILETYLLAPIFYSALSKISKIDCSLRGKENCMLGGQPNRGWQLCFPLKCTPVGPTSDSMTVPMQLLIY